MKPSSGFTIIELVISIFILSVAVVGIFNAFSIITILTSDSADRLTATYLAQEGMEIVRNIRDTNWLKMDAYCASNDCSAHNDYSWVDGLDDCASGCELDYTETRAAIDYLYSDANGFYGYNANDTTPTKFKRKILITPITDINEQNDHILKVTVQVSWDKKATTLNSVFIPASICCTSKNDAGCNAYGNNNNCVATEETLYNWYK